MILDIVSAERHSRSLPRCMVDRQTTLSEAVARHVHAGDTLHIVVGHHRWTAAAREVVRQWWERDPQFTLVMLSLSSLGALFFRGGLVRKVITGYSGDTFPNFTPNPWFADAYRSGAVEVEHWSFLAFAQRLEAAARGLPAIATRSIAGSSMEANAAYARVDSPFGEVGLLAPLQPDVALLHAPVADRAGNIALQPPLLEGVWGALAARRGAIVTVEKIVDDLRPWSHLVKIPAHRVLAVVEAPLGAHPGGVFAGDLPVAGYGEDYDFWVEARAATRGDGYDDWIRHWVLEVDSQDAWLERLGAERVAALRGRAAADSWQADEAAFPPDLAAPTNGWERAAVFGARYLADRIVATEADAVLAGAGVANLSAWLGVELAQARGAEVTLTAEIGLWGYDPVPADPFVLNHRNFPSATMLTDAQTVLGSLVGGAGTTTIGCLGGAQIDRFGNINSTLVPGGAFLVGSGGGNDVASVAAECIVVATLNPTRTPAECGYVTSPGRSVRALVTDLGLLEKVESASGADELVLTAVPKGPEPIAERIERARAACGWELRVATEVGELPEPEPDEVGALRRWDPRGWFLRAR
jgi:acyl CoA:acetate/3-ketoacid CoA transferase alpha subunit/acyl CoA:acetate/3-ketoacid CoA transferase beta subunit